MKENMTQILNGKALALKHEELLKERLDKLAKIKRNGYPRQPQLVSFCNSEDLGSVKYTEMKQKKAEDLGINFLTEFYLRNETKEKIASDIAHYNRALDIDGIMLQLPLPETLESSEEKILNLIDPKKDVDGLVKTSPFLPATIKGVISILDEYIPDWRKMETAVVGATGEMGGDMIAALKDLGLYPLEISRREDNFSEIKKAKLVISATGQEGLVTEDLIVEGVILVDIGLGDFDPSCFEKATAYTPKIGGVGPMTVISLMENVVDSYMKRVLE